MTPLSKGPTWSSQRQKRHVPNDRLCPTHRPPPVGQQGPPARAATPAVGALRVGARVPPVDYWGRPPPSLLRLPARLTLDPNPKRKHHPPDPQGPCHLAGFKSERWPASPRNRWPASSWNAWPASSESAPFLNAYVHCAEFARFFVQLYQFHDHAFLNNAVRYLSLKGIFILGLDNDYPHQSVA